jgi:hypothetical protein
MARAPLPLSGPLLVALLVGALGAGCEGPCRALAQRICECEPNARTRASCVQEVESNGSVRQPTAEEQERCNELLDTCDCDALEREDFVACGLTKPPRRAAQP